jgi:hypothetical protein
MGFSDGRFSIWTGKRAQRSWRSQSHASHPPRVRQWQHHRERRFHRPQEALGFGYEQYYPVTSESRPRSDTFQQPAPAEPPDPESRETAVDSALTSEIEKVQRTSVNGIQICAMVLLLLLVVINHKNIMHWVSVAQQQVDEVRVRWENHGDGY